MKAILIKQILTFLLSFVCAILLTPPIAKILVKFGVVDQPSARRINKRPIPRGGGVALILSFFLATFFAWSQFGIANTLGRSTEELPYLLSATGLIILTGLADDLFGLKPLVKLAGQIGAAVLVYTSGISIGNLLIFSLPEWLNCCITLGWIIVIVNAFNLIDGLDGLASGLAVIGAAGLIFSLYARGKYIEATSLVALMGATLGFLRFNYNPAVIFLGDTGSMFLGFMLALVPLEVGGKAALATSILVPLLIVGVPIFDTMLAIWRRTMRAQLSPTGHLSQVLLPDVEHLHHRLLASGLSQRKTASMLYLLALVMVLMAVGVTLFQNRTRGIIMLGVIAIIAILSRQLSRVELWYTGKAFQQGFQSNFQRALIPIYILCDVAILCFSWWFSACLVNLASFGSIHFSGLHYRSFFPVYFCAIFYMFLFFKAYRRIWSQYNIRDFLVMILAIVVGWGIGNSVCTIFFVRYAGSWRHSVAFLLILLPLMLFIRIVRITINSFLSYVEKRKKEENVEAVRYLVYGASERILCFKFLSGEGRITPSKASVVGIIDDDASKKQGYYHGHRIFGGIEVLETMIQKYRVKGIFVLVTLSEENEEKVMEIAKKNLLNVYRFSVDYTDYKPETTVKMKEEIEA